MKRTPEPELMEDELQARAYAEADFSEAHGHIMRVFDIEFPGLDIEGNILDLGCGPGDITFRLARRFPRARVYGVDGSRAMLELAEERRSKEQDVAERVTFILGRIPGAPIPPLRYDVITGNGFLHHLHDPRVLWDTVIEYSHPWTVIFIADLFRPESEEEARRMVERYAADEAGILRRDFYNSFLAAFTPEEIGSQLKEAGLDELRVRKISDRHVIIWGVKE